MHACMRHRRDNTKDRGIHYKISLVLFTTSEKKTWKRSPSRQSACIVMKSWVCGRWRWNPMLSLPHNKDPSSRVVMRRRGGLSQLKGALLLTRGVMIYIGCSDWTGRLAWSHGIKGEEREDGAQEKEAGCVPLGQAALILNPMTSVLERPQNAHSSEEEC